MKKLLWVTVSILLTVSACKTKKTQTPEKDIQADTAKIWQAPTPASDNPKKYDLLKNELNKRRQQKKKK